MAFAVVAVLSTAVAAFPVFAVVTVLVFTAAALFLLFALVAATLCGARSVMIWHSDSSVCI